MAVIDLNVPQPALDEIQRQLDQHNESTGAQLQLKPYLERVLLEIAGVPALQNALPALEKARDEGYNLSVKAKQTEILQTFAEDGA